MGISYFYAPMEPEIALLKEEIRRLQCVNRLLTDRLLALETTIPHSPNLQKEDERYLPHSKNLQVGIDTSLPLSKNIQEEQKNLLPHSQNLQRGIESSVPLSQNMQGGIKTFRAAGHFFANDEWVVAYLTQELRRDAMKGVRRKTVPHVAAALLQISRGGQLDYHYVRSHYGYSERGSSKFITMLLRRGLLERRGGRATFLTERGSKHFPEGFF